MTQKARQSQSSSKAAVLPVVLFGVDQHGKPTAARFPEGQARLAAKAAEQLHLRVLTVANPAVAELAATLPMGRIHASGKGFVPNVRGDLYAKLLRWQARRPTSRKRLCRVRAELNPIAEGRIRKNPPKIAYPKIG